MMSALTYGGCLQSYITNHKYNYYGLALNRPSAGAAQVEHHAQ